MEMKVANCHRPLLSLLHPLQQTWQSYGTTSHQQNRQLLVSLHIYSLQGRWEWACHLGALQNILRPKTLHHSWCSGTHELSTLCCWGHPLTSVSQAFALNRKRDQRVGMPQATFPWTNDGVRCFNTVPLRDTLPQGCWQWEGKRQNGLTAFFLDPEHLQTRMREDATERGCICWWASLYPGRILKPNCDSRGHDSHGSESVYVWRPGIVKEPCFVDSRVVTLLYRLLSVRSGKSIAQPQGSWETISDKTCRWVLGLCGPGTWRNSLWAQTSGNIF